MFRNAKSDDKNYIQEHLHSVNCRSKYIFSMKTSINHAFDYVIIAKLFALCCLGCTFFYYMVSFLLLQLYITQPICMIT